MDCNRKYVQAYNAEEKRKRDAVNKQAEYWERKQAVCSGETSSKKSSSTSSYTYTGKGYSNDEWPDCDDYDDIEDFLDEWDGYMPDGSDAEEYWSDWGYDD